MKVQCVTWPRRVGPRTWRPRRSSAVSQVVVRDDGYWTWGTAGGLIRTIGSAGTSPSSVSHLNSSSRLLYLMYLTAPVLGFQRSSASAMNVCVVTGDAGNQRNAEVVAPEGLEQSGRCRRRSAWASGPLLAAPSERSVLGLREARVPHRTASASLVATMVLSSLGDGHVLGERSPRLDGPLALCRGSDLKRPGKTAVDREIVGFTREGVPRNLALDLRLC